MSEMPAETTLSAALDGAEELIYVCTADGVVLECNDRLPEQTGLSEDTLTTDGLGVIDPGGTELEAGITQALETETTTRVTASVARDGVAPTTYEWSFTPIEDEMVVGTAREVTTPQKSEQTMTMPVVEIWDGIVLSPIVGKLSADQAELFTETLLRELVEYEATVALIDITGVQSVDTQTAQHLIDTIRAVDLLGADVIITGIGPDLSQTLVKLGIGFEAETRASLIDGFKTALEMQGVSVNSR